MKSLNFYFDEARRIHEIERDAVLARRLGITPQELNRARKKGWLPDPALEVLSELTGTPVGVLVLTREGSKGGKYESVFTQAAELMKQSGAALAIIIAIITAIRLGWNGGEGSNEGLLSLTVLPIMQYQGSLLPEIMLMSICAAYYFSRRFFRFSFFPVSADS